MRMQTPTLEQILAEGRPVPRPAPAACGDCGAATAAPRCRYCKMKAKAR